MHSLTMTGQQSPNDFFISFSAVRKSANRILRIRSPIEQWTRCRQIRLTTSRSNTVLNQKTTLTLSSLLTIIQSHEVSTMNYIQKSSLLSKPVKRDIFTSSLCAARIVSPLLRAHLIDFNVGSRLRYEELLFLNSRLHLLCFKTDTKKNWATLRRKNVQKAVRRKTQNFALDEKRPYKGRRASLPDSSLRKVRNRQRILIVLSAWSAH